MRNGEYYADPTASKALGKVKRGEQKAEKKAAKRAIKECRKILKRYGFAMIGRLKLRGERSGKTYE